MKHPLFSVIVPTKNSERTLRRAIESVVSQTFSEVEVIVVDGDSSDGTLPILRGFCDDRLRFVSELDDGIYHAMNKGIELSRGDWLYFMGSDDYLWDEKVLDDVVGYLKKVDAHFIYGNVCSPDLGDAYDGEFDVEKLCKRNICHQAVFCKRDVFVKLGMFDTRYKVLGDYDFNIRCFHDTAIVKSFFNRRIAYYGPAGASRTLNKVELMRDRYLLGSTMSKHDRDSQRVNWFYQRLANQVLGIWGVQVLLFARESKVLQEFMSYDSKLRYRVFRAMLRRLLRRIAK